MTEDANPIEHDGVLDLSLFSLPVTGRSDTAEVSLATRRASYGGRKERFWSLLARRIDLTGSGSLVTHRPSGPEPPPSVSKFSERIAPLLDRVDAHAAASSLVSQGGGRKLDLHRQVAAVISEVTPQFFLRNIVRLERDVNVRYPRYAHAVWREDIDEFVEAARHPKMERPSQTHFLEGWTVGVMTDELRDRRANVMGFAWEEEITGQFKHPPRRTPPFAFYQPPIVSVWELSLEPAPPQRSLQAEKHRSTLRGLGERYDGTRDDMIETLARRLEEMERGGGPK